MASSDSELLTLKGGLTLPLGVIRRMIEIEAKGGAFTLLADGHFRVLPVSVLTTDDAAFLRAHRALVRSAVAYCDRQTVSPC